jgi:uncharacterized protein (TIGR02147 family)
VETPAQNALASALRQAFVASQVKNPAYSLRSFAKRLAVSPSALSEILNGKRRVSAKLANRLADKLALPPEQRQELLAQLQPGATAKPSPSFVELDVDQFAVMSEWYHFAILSLMETKDFVSDSAWIAARLNIKVRDAAGAVERLIRLGMVKKGRGGKLALTQARFSTSDGVRNLSLQRYHAANLLLAQASLETDPVAERDFCATTMAIDPARLPEAKKMIRDFQDKMMDFLEAPGKQTEVYNLCMQLFPLSH